jgi:hypothetical protein
MGVNDKEQSIIAISTKACVKACLLLPPSLQVSLAGRVVLLSLRIITPAKTISNTCRCLDKGESMKLNFILLWQKLKNQN